MKFTEVHQNTQQEIPDNFRSSYHQSIDMNDKRSKKCLKRTRKLAGPKLCSRNLIKIRNN